MAAHMLDNDMEFPPEVVEEPKGPRIFVIPAPNMARFEERFAKLVKRAIKIGCEPPTYTVVGESIMVIEVVIGEEEDQWGRVKEVRGEKPIPCTHIVFQTSEVIVAGYEFLATLEHGDEGNILHVRAGAEGVVPKAYREAKPWCDHCKTLRRRNDTFVVRKVDDGTCLQVGRNCLADFLGKDASRYAAMAELYFELDELAEASEEGGGDGWGSGGPQYDYLDRYLSFVAEVISLIGWKSRSVAKEFGGTATANEAYRHLHPTKEDIRDNNLLFRTPSEKSVQMAKDAIAWCQEISDAEVDASDYLYNIRTISKREVVSGRQLGYAASIVSGYQRHLGKLIQKKRFADQALISKYVGEVGDRSVFNLLIEKVITSESDFGTSFIHLMSDKDGNRFVWFSSSHKLEENTDVVLKGTVKKHDERNGVKQTILSRCEQLVMKTYIVVWNDKIAAEIFEVQGEDEKAARKAALEVTKAKRVPRGTTFQEKTVEPMVPVMSERENGPSQEV